MNIRYLIFIVLLCTYACGVSACIKEQRCDLADFKKLTLLCTALTVIQHAAAYVSLHKSAGNYFPYLSQYSPQGMVKKMVNLTTFTYSNVPHRPYIPLTLSYIKSAEYLPYAWAFTGDQLLWDSLLGYVSASIINAQLKRESNNRSLMKIGIQLAGITLGLQSMFILLPLYSGFGAEFSLMILTPLIVPSAAYCVAQNIKYQNR